jgi:hypothetical protein
MITMSEYVKLQIKEIEKHKWIESERAHRDLTGTAELDWICNYAKPFRAHIESIYGIVADRTTCITPSAI